jgi:hypothetical protein
MIDLKTDEHDMLSFVQPGTLWGALAYLAIFVVLAMLHPRRCAPPFTLR